MGRKNNAGKKKISKPCKGIMIDPHNRLYSLDNMEMEAMELQRRLYNIACLCMLMCSQIDLGLFGNPSFKTKTNVISLKEAKRRLKISIIFRGGRGERMIIIIMRGI